MYKLKFFTFFLSIILTVATPIFAQHPFQTVKPLKVYTEPSVYTRIIAITQPTDSIGVIRQTVQEGLVFWRVCLYTKSSDASIQSICGFIATADLDKKDEKTLKILDKIEQSSFANVEFLLEYLDENEQIKVVNLIALDAKKSVLSEQTRFADDFFGKKARISVVVPTASRYLSVQNHYYLRLRHKYKFDADYNYTIKAVLRKRNILNYFFRPSKILTIDSLSGRAYYSAIQAVRKRDSCIVWHSDDSHTPYKWSGGCKNGYANGTGMLQLDTNRIFRGRLEMGMMQGEGTLRDNAWEVSGNWQQGELHTYNTVNTVLYYKNSSPAHDTATYKMYPTSAPMTRWYAARDLRLEQGHWQGYTKGFRKNDVRFPYLASSYQIVLPDNENPAYKTYATTDCISFTTWKYTGLKRVGILFDNAPFFDVWCSKKPQKPESDARLYYWAHENKWYRWGLAQSSGPYPTFADAVKTTCGCKH